MKISLPKRIFLTKNEIFNTKRDGFYQNLYNILSKIIIQGLHLIFDFQESKYPNFSTKMKHFVPKMRISIPKRDK